MEAELSSRRVPNDLAKSGGIGGHVTYGLLFHIDVVQPHQCLYHGLISRSPIIERDNYLLTHIMFNGIMDP